MNKQDEQSHRLPSTSGENESQSSHALWEIYQTAQSRHQRLYRPIGVILGLVLIALLGVALWIVAIL